MAASERVGHSVNFSSAVLYATATRAPRPPWSLPTSSKSVAVNYVSLFDFVNVTGGGRSVRFLRPPPSLAPSSTLCMQCKCRGLLARSLEDAFLGHPHAGLLLLELQHSTLFVVAG